MLITLLNILSAWIVADIFTGVVHYWQDRLVLNASKIGFINRIAQDSEDHHNSPRSFIKLSLWENINTSAYVSWPLSIALFSMGAPTVIWLAMFFSSFANIIHRWAHMSRTELGLVIKFMQDTGLFSSRKNHLKHHYDSKGIIARSESISFYCPMSDWVNPIFNKIILKINRKK